MSLYENLKEEKIIEREDSKNINKKIESKGKAIKKEEHIIIGK